MDIRLWNELIAAIGAKKLANYGVQEEERRWQKYQEINLARFTTKQVEQLIQLVSPHEKEKGAKTVVADCQTWLAILGGAKRRPRSVKQFSDMLIQLLIKSADANKAEGRIDEPRVYMRDEERGVWLAYYVSKVVFHPERNERGDYYPAYTQVSLQWIEFGGNRGKSITFYAEDCMGMNAEEALVRKGYVLETKQMWEEYSSRKAQWEKWVDKIGKQFLATGHGTDDCDGNPKGRDSSWYWHATHSINLDRGGEPARVVIDVFYEEEKEERGRRHYDDEDHADKRWWHLRRARADKDEEDDDGEIVDPDEVPYPTLPLHPNFACFDMKRHLRLRIDVGQLQEYVYDPHLSSKLILPDDSRNLVEMLLAHKGQFRDIVRGKSGGAVILCAGIPGTGKTLTAEVYAEVMARPLYTVQASQLGTNPDDLEDELLKTFARATRWNAIMLLDEADVYVHSRGDDLQQNAIVGVFLRVLEYYRGVLFMTTNRSDLVDDAIASRCVARIDYKAPTLEAQKAIWHVLSTTAGIDIDVDVVEAVAALYPELTGRDVKNLLKLAKLVSDSRECPITLDVLRFVKRFKPTTSTNEKEEEEIHLPPMPEPVAGNAEEVAEEEEAGPDHGPAFTWQEVARDVFQDGAPHAPAEVKEAVKTSHPQVHQNAVTGLIISMTKSGRLARLPSGLYQRKED